MASKIKVDTLETADGTGSIALSNQLSGMTVASLPTTGTLPALSGANLTALTSANLTGALPAISGASLTGLSSGLSEADQWRLHTGFSGGGVITTNLERNDSASFTKLGTGMTQSSGVFAFPSTGYWLVTFNLAFELNIDNYAGGHKIYYTGDNGSTWVTAASAASSSAANAHYHTVETKEIFDITDISNQKVKFGSGAGQSTNGNTSYSHTSMVFIKLGET
jgi:hypothetical protein